CARRSFDRYVDPITYFDSW
nr:immunoglobulin heavy chain junction region [Macaca mulatta]MOV39237.1 immunoglobulin heavy chain junction region [Macaca mulatta]MOV39285.1 immunoglobulin heavy chain junction region [Macaca mulatta]MOV41740.1 immunoglobulin heavy chain junction region [Macaca mulatta]MOV42385.1 immunoglobulin heavy chain junction region [Macaca mulatta]